MNGVNLETADAQEIGITYEMMQVRKCMIYSQIATVMSTNISGAASNDGFVLNKIENYLRLSRVLLDLSFISLFYKGFSIIFPKILDAM